MHRDKEETKVAGMTKRVNYDLLEQETLAMAVIEKETITCESLHLLLLFGEQLLDTLRVVYHDLVLRQSKRLIFALDYSELHTYLWPERSAPPSPQVTRELFREKNIEFTVPPGAAIEFLVHLKAILSSSQESKLKFQELASNQMIICVSQVSQKPSVQLNFVGINKKLLWRG